LNEVQILRSAPSRLQKGSSHGKTNVFDGQRRRGLRNIAPARHHPDTQANVITTDFSDWATNCPENKVTAVQISHSNGPSRWQEQYDEFSRESRRIAPLEAAE
jgi:predicted molibdopterin-dependent oxidoreductase YjgC